MLPDHNIQETVSSVSIQFLKGIIEDLKANQKELSTKQDQIIEKITNLSEKTQKNDTSYELKIQNLSNKLDNHIKEDADLREQAELNFDRRYKKLGFWLGGIITTITLLLNFISLFWRH